MGNEIVKNLPEIIEIFDHHIPYTKRDIKRIKPKAECLPSTQILTPVSKQEFIRDFGMKPLEKEEEEPLVEKPLQDLIPPYLATKYLSFMRPLKDYTVNHPDECAHYLYLMECMPEVLPREELESIITNMQLVSYTLALRELDEIVTDNSRTLAKDKRERVRKLLRKARSMDVVSEQSEEETYAHTSQAQKMFLQGTPLEYRVRLVRPDTHWKELGKMLAAIGNCWLANEDKITNPDTAKKLQWQQADIDEGTCIMLISEKKDETGAWVPQVQTRGYIVKTKKGENILFYDAVEGGRIGWDSITDWVVAERGRELAYSVAASVYVAQQLSLSKLVLAERETREIGKHLGCTEEEVEQKLGIPGHRYGSKGPYTYRLEKNSKAYMLPVADVTEAPSDIELSDRLNQLCGIVAKRGRKLQRNNQKIEEIESYLVCAERINQTYQEPTRSIDESITYIREQLQISC